MLGVVRAATEALGVIALAKYLGIELGARLHVDASAAIGILERKGVGRVRHLDVGTLWLQEAQLRKILSIQKVLGTANPADLMTKHLGRDQINQYCKALGVEFRGGRSEVAQQLHAFEERHASAIGGSEKHRWRRISENHWRGRFSNARSHRAPPVPWDTVVRRTTRDENTGKMLK